jgi:hypothetical protein
MAKISIAELQMGTSDENFSLTDLSAGELSLTGGGGYCDYGCKKKEKKEKKEYECEYDD